MASDRREFIRILEAAIEDHFDPIDREYSWVTCSGELVWTIGLDGDPGLPWFLFKPVRYAHRDWVRPDMSNMECAPIVDDKAVLPPFDESYELDYSAILGPIVSVFFDSGLPDRHRIFARTEDERYRDLAIRKRDYEVFFHRLKANLCEFRTLEDMANLLIRTRPGTTREDVEEFFRQRREAMKTRDR